MREAHQERGLSLSNKVDMAGNPMTLKESEAKIEDVKPVIVDAPFATFYDPMKVICDELIVKYGGDLRKVRENMPKANYVVCDLSEHIKKALETNAETIYFSADALAKQLKHHPELTINEYISVFGKVKGYAGKVYDRGRQHAGLEIEVDGRFYRVILKPTQDNSEVYFVSLNSLDERHLATFRKSGHLG